MDVLHEQSTLKDVARRWAATQPTAASFIFLHGRIGEFAIWSRTLSDHELRALYRAGTVH